MLSVLGWIMVLYFIDPQNTGNLGFILFYLSLFFALSSALSLASYFARLIFTRFYSRKETVQISFRQSLFLSIIICLALFLQANRLMTWLNISLLAAMVAVIEFLILSISPKKADNSN